jgi:hypothetical protein
MIELIKNTAAVARAIALMLLWLAVPIAGAALVMAVFPLLQVLWLAALGGLVLYGFWGWVRRGFKPHPDAVAYRKEVNDNIQALLQEFGLPDTWENRCRVSHWREKQSWSYPRDKERQP